MNTTKSTNANYQTNLNSKTGNKNKILSESTAHSVFSNILRNDFITPSTKNQPLTLKDDTNRIQYNNKNTQRADIFDDHYNSERQNIPTKKVVEMKYNLSKAFLPNETKESKFSTIKLKQDIDKVHKVNRKKDKIERFYNEIETNDSIARKIKLEHTYNADEIISKKDYNHRKSSSVILQQPSNDMVFGKRIEKPDTGHIRTYKNANDSSMFSNNVKTGPESFSDKICNQNTDFLSISRKDNTDNYKPKQGFNKCFNNVTGKSQSGFYLK